MTLANAKKKKSKKPPASTSNEENSQINPRAKDADVDPIETILAEGTPTNTANAPNNRLKQAWDAQKTPSPKPNEPTLTTEAREEIQKREDLAKLRKDQKKTPRFRWSTNLLTS